MGNNKRFFLEKFNTLFEHQFGFRQKYSTVLALIEITDNIKENLDNGNCVSGLNQGI